MSMTKLYKEIVFLSEESIEEKAVYPLKLHR